MSSKVYFKDGDKERIVDLDLVHHASFWKNDDTPCLTIWYGGDSSYGVGKLFFTGDIATRLWKTLKMMSHELPV